MQACQGVEDIVMADSVSADDTGEELMEVEADHVLVPGPLHDADLLIAYSTIKGQGSELSSLTLLLVILISEWHKTRKEAIYQA